jgi:hypothetical protein
MLVDNATIKKIPSNFFQIMMTIFGTAYSARNMYKDAMVVLITRYEAQKLLEMNRANRKIRAQFLKLLKNQMDEGLYRDTGASITIYWDCLLGDGQHRLKAFLMSKLKTIEVTIRWGNWYADTFCVTDQGFKRSTHEAINVDKIHSTVAKFINKFVLSSVNTNMGNAAWIRLCELTKAAFQAMYTFEVDKCNKQMFRNPMRAAFFLYYTAAKSVAEKNRVLSIWHKLLESKKHFSGKLAEYHVSLENNNNLGSDKERKKAFYESCAFFDPAFEKNGYEITEEHMKRIVTMGKTLFN